MFKYFDPQVATGLAATLSPQVVGYSSTDLASMFQLWMVIDLDPNVSS
jgi:hypothetical protein